VTKNHGFVVFGVVLVKKPNQTKPPIKKPWFYGLVLEKIKPNQTIESPNRTPNSNTN